MSATSTAHAVRQLAGECAVYRMFDAEKNLLYVGMSGNIGQRFGDHNAKRWFPLVVTITLEWHADARRASEAETRAIIAEDPLYNLRGVTHVRLKSPKPLRPFAAPEDSIAVADVLAAFDADRQLGWRTIAERLAFANPGRWAGVTTRHISAQLRALGVPSACLREPLIPGVRWGCRRADVESVSAATHRRSP
jgi:predicted GIY-YIG superfamily endonuclease